MAGSGIGGVLAAGAAPTGGGLTGSAGTGACAAPGRGEDGGAGRLSNPEPTGGGRVDGEAGPDVPGASGAGPPAGVTGGGEAPGEPPPVEAGGRGVTPVRVTPGPRGSAGGAVGLAVGGGSAG